MFAQAFVQDLLAQIGLVREDFVTFFNPVRIREVIVAETSFEENHCVHEIYGQFMRRIADDLTGGNQAVKDTLVYITKAKLATGTARIINEEKLVERLGRAGVDIFYPESHSIAEQILLWRTRTMISGFLGSAMLTGAFAGQKTLAVLNHEAQVYSNQVLIDRLNDNVATYRYPHDDLIRHDADGAFELNFELRDPTRTAEEFIRVIDVLQNGPPRARRRDAVPRSVSTLAYVDGPLGINLSRNRPARISSILPPHSRRNSLAGEAGGAVDGTLEFTYGFHSGFQQDPWWSVDLGQCCEIHEVRLFNRIDIGATNSCRLCILVSKDEIDWVEENRREDERPFGGADGRPYRWQPERPVVARHIKIQVMGTTYFHLHEVEVFGESEDLSSTAYERSTQT